MTEPTTEFEQGFAVRLQAYLDAAVGEADPAKVAAEVMATAERLQVVRPLPVRRAAPPTRWRPIAAIAAVLAVALGVVLLAGAPDGPAPSPSPTAAVVVPSTTSVVPPSSMPSNLPAESMRLSANGLLAWAEDGAIHLSAPDGSRQRVFDHGGGPAIEPVWSPDGRWLAFRVFDGERGSLWQIDLVDDQTEVLTGPEIDVRGGATWSPNGQLIAFTADTGEGSTVMVVHLATLRIIPVGAGKDADWAPDNLRLVFVQSGEQGDHLAVAEVNGDVRQLTDGVSDTWPDWSPIDDRIVFSRLSQDGGVERELAMVVEADGTGLRPIVEPEPGVRDRRPGFDPFGGRVAFTRDRSGAGGGYELALVDADGSNLRRVGDEPWPWSGSPRWSPDGRLVIADARCCNFGGLSEWVIVEAETGQPGYVFEPNRSSAAPSWQPLRYAVRCGPLEVGDCREQAVGVVAAALAAQPGKRVVRVDFKTECGSYDLLFTDGTGVGADVLCVPD